MLKRCGQCLFWIPHIICDWVRGFFQLIYGIWNLSKLPKPRVTFFGGSKLKFHDPVAQLAHKIANELNENGVSIITGGGPGIMQAANCGAKLSTNGVKTIGIYTEIPNEKSNECLDIAIKIDSLVVRSWLLMKYSQVYLFFPGGFGTLHEFFQLVVLMSTKQLDKGPIILVGSSYWQPLVTWLKELEKGDYIAIAEQSKLFIIEDDFETIKCLVLGSCKK